MVEGLEGLDRASMGLRGGDGGEEWQKYQLEGKVQEVKTHEEVNVGGGGR